MIWVGLAVLAVAAGIVLGTGIATGLNGVKVLVAMTSTCALLLSAVLATGLHRQSRPRLASPKARLANRRANVFASTSSTNRSPTEQPDRRGIAELRHRRARPIL